MTQTCMTKTGGNHLTSHAQIWISGALHLHCRDFINTLMPRQEGRYFTDHIFKYIFLNENVLISIKIVLKFIPN